MQLLLLTAKTWIFINRPMGEEQGSQIRIFANGQEIASGIGEMTLTPSAEQPETEAPTVWNNPPSFEITGTITNDGQVAEWINDIIRRSKFSRKEVKRMFYAVTHHQKVVFDIRLEFNDGTIKEGEIVCRLPRQLREFFGHTYHLRCQYRIEYDI